MKVEIGVPEVVRVFNEIQKQPERIFEMIRVEIRENVGEYLSKLMDMSSPIFLGGKRLSMLKETSIIAMVPMVVTLR